METQARPATGHLVMNILEGLINDHAKKGGDFDDLSMGVSAFGEAKKYSFFQINQLLHRYISKKNASTMDAFLPAGDINFNRQHTIRYKSNPSLSFPSSDIQNIRFWNESDTAFAEVVVNFMGLFGPSSPLPAFFTERILHADPGDTSVQDFLDIFNHRILDLLQRVWEKYRYYQCYERGQDNFSQWMFSLIGISHVELERYSDLQWERLIPYAGLIAMKVTNVEKVSRIIEGYFDIHGVAIEQCVLREVMICEDQTNRMGIINCAMGEDLVLGESVLDRMGKIRINILNLTIEEFKRFLPSGDWNQPLQQLIQFLMTDQFDVEIRIQANSGSHMGATMGEDSMMGWNTCLGEPEITENYDAII